ncbi:hypothetical protein GQ43DRAFT_162812 [Delitschia confertaspora ATCC 74209]|uniref:Uncharacterized protein n=1 Tax=Delitschia confertaspora ATCC 74209 TaxID=1513339 RepID=A0A9P4MSV7_9PLEO|nr:hypothetical protein GQ43DRAFT_162812 [Delitschia confertaspora ATCC 74209]
MLFFFPELWTLFHQHTLINIMSLFHATSIFFGILCAFSASLSLYSRLLRRRRRIRTGCLPVPQPHDLLDYNNQSLISNNHKELGRQREKCFICQRWACLAMFVLCLRHLTIFNLDCKFQRLHCYIVQQNVGLIFFGYSHQQHLLITTLHLPPLKIATEGLRTIHLPIIMLYVPAPPVKEGPDMEDLWEPVVEKQRVRWAEETQMERRWSWRRRGGQG